jgi:hypothetical protein
MNTRKYPRSTLEAFGCDANTSCAIERPHPKEQAASVILAIIIGVLMTCALVHWWVS